MCKHFSQNISLIIRAPIQRVSYEHEFVKLLEVWKFCPRFWLFVKFRTKLYSVMRTNDISKSFCVWTFWPFGLLIIFTALLDIGTSSKGRGWNFVNVVQSVELEAFFIYTIHDTLVSSFIRLKKRSRFANLPYYFLWVLTVLTFITFCWGYR